MNTFLPEILEKIPVTLSKGVPALNLETVKTDIVPAAYNYLTEEWMSFLKSPGERRRLAQEMLDQGALPPLGSGFQFVIDRRPEGEEDRPIPSAEYTAYFSRRQVPLADVDHKEREHDLGHVPTFQDMFQCAVFGDLVEQAASSSVGDPELCKQFTRAMDSFGDDLRNLEEMNYGYHTRISFKRSSFVQSARRHLQDLVLLGTRRVPGGANRHEEREKLLSGLWFALGLHVQESKADYERELALKHPEACCDDDYGFTNTSYIREKPTPEQERMYFKVLRSLSAAGYAAVREAA